MQPLPYKDFTIKSVLTDAKEVEQKIISLGAQFIGDDIQKDHYFETSKGKLKWREGKIENLITHYERIIDSTFERTLVYRYDRNPTHQQIDELFYKEKFIGTVSKARRIYQLGNIKIHLDQLPDAKKYIEIEAIDRDQTHSELELKNQCLDLQQKLGIATENLMRTGYFR